MNDFMLRFRSVIGEYYMKTGTFPKCVFVSRNLLEEFKSRTNPLMVQCADNGTIIQGNLVYEVREPDIIKAGFDFDP